MIQVTSDKEKEHIALIDGTGRLIRVLEIATHGRPASISIDMSMLPRGVYFIRNNDQTIKVVKE